VNKKKQKNFVNQVTNKGLADVHRWTPGPELLLHRGQLRALGRRCWRSLSLAISGHGQSGRWRLCRPRPGRPWNSAFFCDVRSVQNAAWDLGARGGENGGLWHMSVLADAGGACRSLPGRPGTRPFYGVRSVRAATWDLGARDGGNGGL